MTHQLGNTEIDLKEIVSVSDFSIAENKTATCFLHKRSGTGIIYVTVTATQKELPTDHRINPLFEKRLKKELEDFKTKWREAVKK